MTLLEKYKHLFTKLKRRRNVFSKIWKDLNDILQFIHTQKFKSNSYYELSQIIENITRDMKKFDWWSNLLFSMDNTKSKELMEEIWIYNLTKISECIIENVHYAEEIIKLFIKNSILSNLERFQFSLFHNSLLESSKYYNL